MQSWEMGMNAPGNWDEEVMLGSGVCMVLHCRYTCVMTVTCLEVSYWAVGYRTALCSVARFAMTVLELRNKDVMIPVADLGCWSVSLC